MQYPPIKTIEAVLKKQIDYRTRRVVTHFRHFFRCFDDQGQATDDDGKIARIELTQRAKDYYQAVRQSPV